MQVNPKTFFQSYWAALLWAAFILLLIGLPGQDLPNIDFWDINFEDKLAHVGVFGIFSLLLLLGYKRHRVKSAPTPVLIFFICVGIGFGGLTELLQGWLFTTRFADIFDFIADAIGSVLGTVLGSLYSKHRARN